MTGDQYAIPGSTAKRHRGSTETAAERVVTAWRAAGHTVDALASSQIRGAAANVDQAQSDWRAGNGGMFAVTRARALLLDLYRAHGPRDDTAGDRDPFAELVAQLDADDA